MTLKNILAAGSLLFLLSGYSAGIIETNGSAEETEAEFPPSMAGMVRIDGELHDLKEGNSRWERKSGTGTEVAMTDAASPPQLAEEVVAIQASPNAVIELEIERDPEISVYHWSENRREEKIELTDHQFQVPVSGGRYIYEVLATWEGGEVSYTFVIEVE